MATIKAYTDLSQSKVLAEILPLETTDMIWVLANPDLPMIRVIAYEDSEKSKYYEILPAWSLAALLGVLPRKVELEDTAYTIGVSLDSINYSNVNNGNLLLEVKVKDNLVDACYEVIIKLYELKML